MSNPTTRDSSTILRASVLDAFRDLGALEDNSVVKAWILNNDPHAEIPDIDDDLAKAVPRLGATPRNKVSFPDDLARTWTNVSIPEREEPDSGSETDTGRKGISKPFRLVPRKKKSKSKTRGKSPSNNGYDTDDGYNSASSSKSSRGRLFKRKPSKGQLASPVVPTAEVPPVPSIDESTSSRNVINKLFRAGRKRKGDQDLGLSPQISNTSSLGTPERSLTPNAPPSRAGSSNGIPSPLPPLPLSNVPSNLSGNSSEKTSQKRMSFAIPSSAFQTNKKKKTFAKRLSIFTSPPKDAESEPHPIAQSLPPSPFLLVAPYGEEDMLVHGSSSAEPVVLAAPIDDSTKSRARMSIASVNTHVFPVSISKTRRRSDTGVDAVTGRSIVHRRASFHSVADAASIVGKNMDMTPEALSKPINPADLKRGRQAPFPVRPVLALPLSARPMSVMPVAEWNMSRFREIGLASDT